MPERFLYREQRHPINRQPGANRMLMAAGMKPLVGAHSNEFNRVVELLRLEVSILLGDFGTRVPE